MIHHASIQLVFPQRYLRAVCPLYVLITAPPHFNWNFSKISIWAVCPGTDHNTQFDALEIPQSHRHPRTQVTKTFNFSKEPVANHNNLGFCNPWQLCNLILRVSSQCLFISMTRTRRVARSCAVISSDTTKKTQGKKPKSLTRNSRSL